MASAIDQRKLAFFQAIERHGNVRRAMQESGVGSLATGYHWLEQFRTHGMEWAHAERRPSRQVPPGIADLIVRLSETQPGWGKARIAGYVNALHGERAVSASGVQSVMRQAGLWLPHTPQVPSLSGGPLDAESLAEVARAGIFLDISGNPPGAVQILEPGLWLAVRANPAAMHAVLREAVEGSWILRGLLQLSHALIDVGRWRSARVVLTWLDAWFASPESRPSPAQAAYQDAGCRYFAADGSIRVFMPRTLPPEFQSLESVSLRVDDIWVEAQQYLALVFRDIDALQAVERLHRVSRELRQPRRRFVDAGRGDVYRGIIEHDLAVAQLLAGWPVHDTYQTIWNALDTLDRGDNIGMISSAWLQLGRVQIQEAKIRAMPSDRAAPLVERTVAAAMAVVEREHSPVLRTNIEFHAVDLLLQVRPATGSDRELVTSLAESVIQRHLARWARLLVEAPHLTTHVTDLQEELSAIGWPT